jgi:hypothetical protein
MMSFPVIMMADTDATHAPFTKTSTAQTKPQTNSRSFAFSLAPLRPNQSMESDVLHIKIG